MAINFPANPQAGDTYASGGLNWVYSGVKWAPGAGVQGPPTGAVQIGHMMDWGVQSLPPGWLHCDGSAISRTTYAALYAVIGTTYGAGNGTTTFNLPDCRGRTTFGWDGGSTGRLTNYVNAANIGASGGHQEVTAHTHPLTDNGHTHTLTDHGHTPALTDPGHGHGVSDPSHGHGIADYGHSHAGLQHQHGLYDPGHSHGVGDPGHAHNINGPYPSGTNAVPGSNSTHLWWGGNIGTDGSGTGIWIGGSGTNAIADWNGDFWSGGANQTPVGIYGNYTGIGIAGASTGITQASATTGITQASASTGITIASSGSGNAGNVPPALVVPKIIFTGVTS